MSLDLARKVAAQPWFRWVERMAWFAPPSGAPDDSGDHGIVEWVTHDGRPQDGYGLNEVHAEVVPDLSDLATLLLVCAQLPPGTWIQERQGWPGQEPGEAARGGFKACSWRKEGNPRYPWHLHVDPLRETRLEALADALAMLEGR